MKNVSRERIDELNKGISESKNLMENLSIDFQLLLGNTYPKLEHPSFAKDTGVKQRLWTIAKAFDNQFGFDIFNSLAAHQSDTIRGLACYLLAMQDFSFVQKLELIKPLATDLNSGVREWAFIALRNQFAENAEESIQLLVPWTISEDENIRRYSSELTRPRGVWVKHVDILKSQPDLGLQILENLKADPAKYVQLSVGNWINDAGKDHPKWALDLCKRWTDESDTKETAKITKRGLRNLR